MDDSRDSSTAGSRFAASMPEAYRSRWNDEQQDLHAQIVARRGPALIHAVYQSSHHSDAAFTLAVRVGVTAHHWRFGDMPPQPQVADSQVPPMKRVFP